MQALQSGLITPAQYQMMMRQMEAGGIGIDTPSARDMVLDMVMNSSNMPEDVSNALGRRGLDTPQERDFLMQQGLLGGGQQPMSPATMPQAPEPTMPMSPMPSAEPSQMQMSPMPLGGGETTYDQNYNPISGRGAPTQNETDFLGQFVDNAKKAMYR